DYFYEQHFSNPPRGVYLAYGFNGVYTTRASEPIPLHWAYPFKEKLQYPRILLADANFWYFSGGDVTWSTKRWLYRHPKGKCSAMNITVTPADNTGQGLVAVFSDGHTEWIRFGFLELGNVSGFPSYSVESRRAWTGFDNVSFWEAAR
ncbi:MAG: hypothetical protein NZ891_00690, partial [bacterium]|nr:hypothetical protein [bacterium]MDW8163249.1 hypothetical protein [Candidatus Omnitrophota bacterium]